MNLKKRIFAAAAFAGVAAFASASGECAWNDVHVPVAPSPLAAGLHGKAVALERITAADVAGDESAKGVRKACWRNERVNAQYLVWSGDGAAALAPTVSDFVSEHGAKIPASCASVRFVRYVRAAYETKDGKPQNANEPAQIVGDALDPAPTVDLPANGFRPVWLTVNVPKDATPDTYVGKLTLAAKDGKRVEFTLTLDVRHDVLPEPAAWKFHLDLWQHPWAVARYHNVKPFSKEHYALLAPLFRTLAEGGQKTITTTLVDLPWNHQNYDAYWSMVEHVKQADGTFKHDYSLFDEYVAFALKCGLGPQIHCYTMASWGNMIYYKDAKTGEKVKAELVAGTPGHEAFWGPFLEEFQKHVEAKGWLGRVYVALDERSREELTATAACIRKHAPKLKLQMTGNKPPSSFAGIELDSYSQLMQWGYVTPELIKEAAARRDRGLITTSYVCCAPKAPNTFTTSSLAESAFLGIYAHVRGFDGMLRWAAFNWPKDPTADSSFGTWRPGDTFILYPGARASTRWEMLRDSIENFEKLKILTGGGRATWRLAASWKNWDFEKLKDADAKTYAKCVADVEEVIDAMCCPGYMHGRKVECEERTWGAEVGYKTPVVEMHVVQHPKAQFDVKGRPLYVVLHSSGHNCVNALWCTAAPNNHDIYLAPDDFFALYLDCKTAPGDWWYGYNTCHGFELSACEKRMLKTIEDVVVKYGIDRDRIYLCGNSMGASGCLGFGLRHGDVFAAIKANVPALVEHACDRMGWDMKKDADAAVDLARLPEPPMFVDHTAPNDMHWSTGHEHLIAMMHSRRYPWAAYWADHKHCNRNSIILAANDMVHSLDWTKIKKSDVLPAFTDAATDTVSPWPDHRDAKGAGQINGFFRWANGKASAKSVSIDLSVTRQTSKHFQIPETISASVTLWRTGEFKPAPGEKVKWAFGGKSGEAAADANGRVTVPALAIAKTPQTLTLSR